MSDHLNKVYSRCLTKLRPKQSVIQLNLLSKHLFLSTVLKGPNINNGRRFI